MWMAHDSYEVGYVPTHLIRDMYVVSLLAQSNKRSTSRNDIVIWVRREEQDT